MANIVSRPDKVINDGKFSIFRVTGKGFGYLITCKRTEKNHGGENCV